MPKLLPLVACSLVACTPQPSADWLVGQWQSRDWGVVYDFEQEGETWAVSTDQGLLWGEMTLTNGDEQLILTAQDGTRLLIQQVSDQKMTLYQAPAEGLLGLTAQVALEKVDE